MNNNNIHKTFLLTLMVVAALGAMFYIPRAHIGGVDLRRINLLSDVQRRDSEGRIIAELRADSLDNFTTGFEGTDLPEVEAGYKDVIPDGMVAIEDFADPTGVNREMDNFYRALGETKKRTVHIAYFGDSFIEGDLFTMELRDLLQKQFGGCGVGWVDIENPTSSFRVTVKHHTWGWDDHSQNDPKRKGFNTGLQGMNGRYFLPHEGARVEYSGQQRYYTARLDTFEMVTVYFTPSPTLRVQATVNGEIEKQIYPGGTTQRAGTVASSSLAGEMGHVSMNAYGGKGSRFYGVALDGRTGIALDNFSMRGSTGWFQENIPIATLQAFDRLRHYDLVVLHYGLNVASDHVSDYTYYINRFKNVINNFKRALPHTSILLIGVSDRDTRRSDGSFQTRKGVKELLKYQRKMASDTHIAFWDFYDAMGGEGSMARLADIGEANRDYTHITIKGGNRLARLLYNVLMVGRNNYVKRTNPKR